MKKVNGLILFAAIIVILVGVIVFSVGNNPPSTNQGNQNPGTIPPTSVGSNTDANVGSVTVTAEELSMHNTQGNCWVGFEGKAYDITDWLPRHPGSAAAIAPYCGTSSEFTAAFEGQHGSSQIGKLMQEGVYKGDLA